MATVMLGIGDYGASRTPGDVVKTLALGSCVAVVVLDPKTHTVGMVHIALPDSSIDPAKARAKPGYFADTGVRALLQTMQDMTGSKNGKGFLIKLAGGASIMDPNNTFNIGKRNILAVKKILWALGMGPAAEDVGGYISRSVAVEVDTGRVTVISPGRGSWDI
ncbi:MAG: chemotaxis protein CheD [Desulfobacterota bacterium]|nr:chemotaxis protein CheD [Thermodesulfobacteriota bacterium]